jgi:hypothetical protein
MQFIRKEEFSFLANFICFKAPVSECQSIDLKTGQIQSLFKNRNGIKKPANVSIDFCRLNQKQNSISRK